ncbi:MAG: hypothetical protein C5B59_10280 [Bacteroidetes bacterium]|nr:MAG: hypothetical protein C5B59_10280 [Bacteroidota bacterium]
MKKRIQRFILLTSASAMLFFSACKKEISTPNPPSSYTGSNFNDLFDAFWNGMNNNYVFWDIDTTNWDRVYNQYKPIFANLNIYSDNDVRSSVNYFRQMVAGLIDGHYNITFPKSQLLSDSSIDPAFDRKRNTPGYHDPIPLGYFFFDLPKIFLDSGYVEGVDSTHTARLAVAVSGTINHNILYFYFNTFELQALYLTPGSAVQAVIKNFISSISPISPSVKGIILDLRGNGGGDVNDLDFLVGRMIDKPLKFGYTRAKNGQGRLDYSPWAPAIVTPQPGSSAISIPIIVIADNFSASLSEITTLAIKTLPNGKFLGETTWGANGPLAPNVYFNGGQFTAGTILTLSVFTSSTMFKYINDQIYEGKGIPPDVAVPDNLNSLKRGIDLQVAQAVSLINQ